MSEWRVVVAAAEGCELGSMCEGTNYNFWRMVDGKLEWKNVKKSEWWLSFKYKNSTFIKIIEDSIINFKFFP